MEKMIFVIDDNDANLTVAASALEDEYMVLTMPGAERMFKILEKKRPNLILLDIEMPEMDGFEALSKLKDNPEWDDIPVVFLTGRTDEGFEQKARNTKVLDIVKKPFTKENLLDTVKKYIS